MIFTPATFSVVLCRCAFGQLFLSLIKWCLITLEGNGRHSRLCLTLHRCPLSSPLPPPSHRLQKRNTQFPGLLYNGEPFESTVANGSEGSQRSVSHSFLNTDRLEARDTAGLSASASPPPISGLFHYTRQKDLSVLFPVTPLLLVAFNIINLAMYQVIFESKAFVNELSCLLLIAVMINLVTH